MRNADKGEIGAILAGIGLALWLFYGAAAIFAITGDNDLNSAETWVGLVAAVIFIGSGFPLVIRYGRAARKGQ